MHLALRSRTNSSTLSLQHAVLCVNCESVTSTRNDECPVCGSRSVLSLMRMLGGSLLVHRAEQGCKDDSRFCFDMEIAITLKHMEGKDMNAVLEGINNLMAPRLGRASLHVTVEPVLVASGMEELKNAA